MNDAKRRQRLRKEWLNEKSRKLKEDYLFYYATARVKTTLAATVAAVDISKEDLIYVDSICLISVLKRGNQG